MTCEQAMELMSAMLDGELEPRMKEALDAHLETCPECRDLAETLRGLDDKLAGLREPAPAGLKKGVLYRIDQATGKAKKSRRGWFGPGAAIGAVAAALVLLVGLGVIPLKGRSMAADTAPMAEYSPVETQAPADGIPKSPMGMDGSQYFNYEPSEGAVAPPESAPVSTGSAGYNGEPFPAETSPAYEGTVDAEASAPADTRHRGDTSGSTAGSASVSETLRSACAQLSAKEDAMVLLYTEFDLQSLLQLLEAEEPALYERLSDTPRKEQDEMTVLEADCDTVLALHEWLLAKLPLGGRLDPEVLEAQIHLMERMEELDPGSGSLYRVVTWAPPDQTVVWPETWPDGWADRVRTEENWELFFPSEDYTPNSDKTAYLAFVP